MPKNKMTYASAIAELEQIVADIESGDIDVDRLTEKVKRASELIAFCKDRLRTTRKEVEKTLTAMEVADEADEK